MYIVHQSNLAIEFEHINSNSLWMRVGFLSNKIIPSESEFGINFFHSVQIPSFFMISEFFLRFCPKWYAPLAEREKTSQSLYSTWLHWPMKIEYSQCWLAYRKKLLCKFEQVKIGRVNDLSVYLFIPYRPIRFRIWWLIFMVTQKSTVQKIMKRVEKKNWAEKSIQ